MGGMKSSLISQLFGVACNLKLSGLKVSTCIIWVTFLFPQVKFGMLSLFIFKIFYSDHLIFIRFVLVGACF
jgi:hypothetical protein